MRVALFSDGIYPYVMGGMQKHSIEFAKSLAHLEIHVDLYHCVAFNESVVEEILDLSPIENKFIQSYCLKFPKAKSYPGHYLMESYRYSEMILNKYLANNANVDLIYAQGFCGWAALKKKKELQLPPIALNFHGLNMFQISKGLKATFQNAALRKYAKWNIQNADLVVLLSEKLKHLLSSSLVNDQKIIVQPNALSKNWFTHIQMKSKDILKVVFIGRNDVVKGLDILIKALIELDNELDRPLSVQIIGSTIEVPVLKFVKINSLGELNDENEVKGILSDSQLLVVPSLSEGFPTVILEAMSQGCLVIASDVGAVSDLVNNKNGWLVKAGSVSDLKVALKNAIDTFNKQSFDAMSSNARNTAELYAWDKITEQFIYRVKELVGK